MVWFRRSVVKSYERDIFGYIHGLQNLDDKQMGKWLAEAILLRVDLENEGSLPTVMLDDGSISSLLSSKLPLIASSLYEGIKVLQKDKNPSSRITEEFLWLWFYSIQTLLKPELRKLGQEMWAELSRGIPYITAELKKLVARSEEEKLGLPSGSRRRVFEVLNHLPPEGLEPITR